MAIFHRLTAVWPAADVLLKQHAMGLPPRIPPLQCAIGCERDASSLDNYSVFGFSFCIAFGF